MMTKNCHHALAVDDDACTIYAVESILTSLGHRVSIASTQEEADSLLEKHRFCYALVDLELPARAGEEARRQTGFNIIEGIRRRYSPAELPTIVMTGHGLRHELSTRAFKMGATDYISKPFDKDHEPLDDKVRQALAMGCESRYESCPVFRALARADAETGGHVETGRSRKFLVPHPNKESVAPPSTREPTSHSIHFGSDFLGSRCRIEFDGQDGWVCAMTFQVLMRLAIGHLVDSSGWIAGHEIHDSHHQALSRARRDLRKTFRLDHVDFIVNDGHGRYLLDVLPERLTYEDVPFLATPALKDLYKVLSAVRDGA